jgi:hypothetical protein
MKIETRERVVEAMVSAELDNGDVVHISEGGGVRIIPAGGRIIPDGGGYYRSSLHIELEDLRGILAEYDRVVSEAKK